jgi:hypothetical protein
MKLEFLERGSMYVLPSGRLAVFLGRMETLVSDVAPKPGAVVQQITEKVVSFKYVDAKTRVLTKEEVSFSFAGFRLIEKSVNQGYLHD